MGDDVIVSEADKPFVETVRIQNFGCARDVTLELTRLHALIGPNDSGKSTVLEAIRTACELIRHGEERLSDFVPRDARRQAEAVVTMEWPVRDGRTRIDWLRTEDYWVFRAEGPVTGGGVVQHDLQHSVPHSFVDPVRGATMIRWDPDTVRQPCELVPEGRTLIVSEKGQGIPAVYDAVLSRDREAFDAIEESVRRHFPTVRSIWLPTSTNSMKALGVVLKDGTRVRANELSEGLLYWLAFAILPQVNPTAFLLVEEPENGLHPSRIAEVVKVLREISKTMQVIIATHSPLVVNELQPNEVTILIRDEKTGTRAKRMDRTTHFQQRQQVYALGELWLSFADGVDEAALVKDDDAKHPAG